MAIKIDLKYISYDDIQKNPEFEYLENRGLTSLEDIYNAANKGTFKNIIIGGGR